VLFCLRATVKPTQMGNDHTHDTDIEVRPAGQQHAQQQTHPEAILVPGLALP
jgi:hypothetical protein